MRVANIYVHDQLAGTLREDEEGYQFQYIAEYLANAENEAVSLTLPLSEKPYTSDTLFPFFDGLIPEGWLLEIVLDNWKLNQRDRMGLLMASCKDCIGTVSVLDPNDQGTAHE